MNLETGLRERCHVNTNEDGDRFVGVKADTDDAVIYFPVGYKLPADDNDLRRDVQNLFGVLSAFLKEDKVIESRKFEAPRTVDFPIHAYLTVITNFLRSGGKYYIESDPEYRTSSRGSINWPRTLREQRALIQGNGSLVFTNMTVRYQNPNQNKKITQIHRYCVYEAFAKLGWLYVPYMPEKPGAYPTNKEAISILDAKLHSSHNDSEQELFGAMKAMLMYVDEKTSNKQYFFGTDDFDHVWEKMIDKAFGVENKDEYFPRARWLLDGAVKTSWPLQPDTIMIFRGKYYVLDAKCYRFGWTGDPAHLPSSASVNKQITYGEYIEKTRSVPNDNLFNAFIMPYNPSDNPFDFTSTFGNIGEAIGDWRIDEDTHEPLKYYERIQGIVMDVRYLMYNYVCIPELQKQELVEQIEKVTAKAPITALA